MQLHKCNADCAAEHGPVQVTEQQRQRLTIDLHCHTLIPAVEKLVADCPQKKAEPDIALRMMGEASVAHNNAEMLPTAGPRLVNVAQRLADMDAMGVDIQVISPSPTQYYYWAERELAAESVLLQNEAIADTCARHPDRLLGLGNIALQHPDLAVEQLTHAVKNLGLKGIEVSTSVNDLELADRSLDPVWAKAEELGAVVFIHPFGTSLGERVNRYYLTNTIGQPLETTIALSYLIFDGTLDRHPGLKILAAHGGGYLPYAIGRSNHARAYRPEATGCRHKPEDYLKRIWFDFLAYEPHALRYLIDQYGIDRLVVGTDYPFDMGRYDVHALVDAIPGLSDAEREQILGGNAAELLGTVCQKAPQL